MPRCRVNYFVRHSLSAVSTLSPLRTIWLPAGRCSVTREISKFYLERPYSRCACAEDRQNLLLHDAAQISVHRDGMAMDWFWNYDGSLLAAIARADGCIVLHYAAAFAAAAAALATGKYALCWLKCEVNFRLLLLTENKFTMN